MRKHYLTNMQYGLFDLVKEAILKSGRTDIFIDLDPIPADHLITAAYSRVRDSLVGSYFSIYVIENNNGTDCSNFWLVYEDLSRTDYWRTYITLSKD